MTILNQPQISPGTDAPRTGQWLTISDFSPGIQQKVMTPGVIQPSPGNAGAASIQNTYRCIALPSGGLGPLPKRYESFTKGITETADHIQSNMVVIPTMFPTSDFYPYERDTRRNFVNFLISHDVDNGDGTSTHYLDKFDPFGTGQLTNLVAQVSNPGLAKYGATYFCQTRCQPTSSSSTGENLYLGWPIVVCSYNTPLFAGYPTLAPTHYYARSYPNAILPYGSAHGFYDYNAGASSVTPPAGGSPPHTHTYNIPGFQRNTDTFTVTEGAHGMCVAHQGRVMFLPDFMEVGPESGAYPQSEQRRHNEAFTYTVPNDYRQDGVQPWSGTGIVDGTSGSTISGTAYEVVFGQEEPIGIGCVYSLSSSDLLIIKHGGGGYLVQGDINAATVRRLPSIVGTGGARCMGTPSPYGFVYGVNHGGVYAWGGGDGSELMSAQLEDDFWISPNTDAIDMYKGAFSTWDNWCLIPNNWLFDGNSWWRIEDDSIAHWTVWQKNPITNVLYGMRDFLPGGVPNPPFADGWDKTQPANSYSWQSHPMGASVERLMEVRTAIVFVQGAGKITLTFTDPEAEPVMEQIDLPPQALAGPVAIRKSTYFKANSITLRIQSDSLDDTIPAPIVHQISLGYDEGLPVQEALT